MTIREEKEILVRSLPNKDLLRSYKNNGSKNYLEMSIAEREDFDVMEKEILSRMSE